MATTGWFSVMLTALLASSTPAITLEGHPVGFKLQDFRGGWHNLDDVPANKLVVIAFLQADCPLSGLYAPKLAELAKGYDKKGVAFFGVDANRLDAPSALARFAREQDLPFPLLKDLGNELADRLGAERAPEVFVLDHDRVVRYRGRVDDQFSFGVHRPAPTKRDLAVALDDLLAGRTVATPRTDAVGCKISRRGKTDKNASVNYSRHVARVLRDRCVACHREGRNRSLFVGVVQRRLRLGRDDRRGRSRRSHAALARQPRVRQVLQ